MTGQSTGHQWYIARDGKQTGPISDIEIKAIAGRGYFREKDLVWRPGFAEWQPALNVFPPPIAAPPPPLPFAPPTQLAPAQQRPASGAIMPPASVWPVREQTAPERQQPLTGPGATRPAWEQTVRPAQPVQPAPSSIVPASALPGARQYEPSPLRPLPTPGPEATARLPLNLPRGPEPVTGRPTQPSQPRFEAPSYGPPQEQAVQRVDTGPELEDELAPAPRTNRMAVAALSITVVTVAAAVWIAAQPGIMSGLPRIGAVTKSIASLGGGSAETQMSSLDASWQKTAHWPVIKREFPDWYGERLREAAQLKTEQKPDGEIAKILVDQIIALRRQNATQALSASTPKLVALASAFLENLKQLKSQSTSQCFAFISQGEATPGVIDLLQVADGTTPSMQRQVAAIFEAIGEGRKSPITHDKPQKGDYDALMEQLGKLGWTQTDVATFADPRALARTEPERVCQMVQDWFVAHISIPDAGMQERLLGETLRPVVSG